jgi:RecG-like helicase
MMKKDREQTLTTRVDRAPTPDVPIAEWLENDRVRVTGTIDGVRALSRRGWPRLEVSLTDGSATVVLVWLGRQAISGVEPGQRLRATGTLLRRSGRRVIHNPAYELIEPLDTENAGEPDR